MVDARTLRADLVAGILGALLVLPQGFAFATLAGLPREYGLYTAIIPCAIAALFGSSRHVVSGPTNANSLALFATLAPLALVGSPPYIELALAVTVIVGMMQFLIGALRLGAIANFISPAALRGFMSGAAALIALHSLTDLLGLTAPASHGVLALFEHIAGHVGDIAPAAFGIGVFTIVVSIAVKTRLPRWPSARVQEGHVSVKTVTKQVGDRQMRFKTRKLLAHRRNDDSLVLAGGSRGEWTPHDLRRTAATMMQSLRVSPDVIDRCQNHALLGSKVRRHYLHYDYADEKREAWRLLGERLDVILSGGNVVPLQRPVRSDAFVETSTRSVG